MNKYLVSILSILLLLTGCHNISKQEQSDKKVNVSAYYRYNNEPMYGIHILAYNYESAYKKVKTGKFLSTDFSHYTFREVKKKYTVSNKVVDMGNYRFGQGIKNNSSDAKEIIKILFDETPDYLTYMNGLKPEIAMSNPDKPNRKFTNKDGKIVGKIPKGITIFQDTTGVTKYRLLDVKEGSVLYLGNTRPDTKKILINDKKNKDDISVDYGSKVTYSIPTTSNQMTVRVSPNFVVDEVNVDYQKTFDPIIQKKAVDGNLVSVSGSPSLSGSVVRYQLKKDQMNNKYDQEKMMTYLSKSLATLHSIDKLSFNFDSHRPENIIIKGHVSSVKTYTIPLLIEQKDDTKDVIEKTIDVYNTSFSQGVFVSDDVSDIKTPQVNSYGINFATYSATTNKPIDNINFVLGRVKKGKVSLFSHRQDGVGWINTQASLKDLNASYLKNSPVELIGNHYIYSDGKERQINLIDNFWGYDETRQRKENSALFKIRGLSSHYKYFLLPLSKSDKVINNGNPIFFKVDKNTISTASKNNYGLNAYIADLSYGNQEYNPISVLIKGQKEKRNRNPIVVIAVALTFIIIIYIAIIYLYIKSF